MPLAFGDISDGGHSHLAPLVGNGFAMHFDRKGRTVSSQRNSRRTPGRMSTPGARASATPTRWACSTPTPGVCTTRTAICMNGSRTGTRYTNRRASSTRPGRRPAANASSAAVSSSASNAPAQPAGTRTRRTDSSTSWARDWRGKRGNDPVLTSRPQRIR